ncbi:MAG: hypothetical protein KAR56_01855 [Thermoplasmata archaeon]|nr:hypothetical protein [Thermoplasmata archaeon]
MNQFLTDTRAVEGLPLKLIITAIVLAITIPMMFGALRTYDRSKVEQEIKSEIDRFISMAQLVYSSGSGNSAVLEFRAAKSTFTGIDYVRFGDVPDGNYSSVVRYRISGMPEVPTVILSPNVPLMSSGNSTFEIMSGNYQIIAECLTTLSDLNGDGLAPDNYVQLSLV